MSLLSIISNHSCVLSFASLENEINIWQINKLLAKEGKLILGRISHNDKKRTSLDFFKVSNIESDLEKSVFNLLEPKKHLEQLFDLSSIKIALIPGLVFDRFNNRLGYGMGYYDKILNEMKNAFKIGIGYKEQFSKSTLPIEKHDVPLNQILLF